MNSFIHRAGWLLSTLSTTQLLYASGPEYFYDNTGILTEMIQKSEKEAPQIVHFAHDANDQCIAIIRSPETFYERVTSLQYDEEGRLIEKVAPDGTKLFYTYNSNGTLNRLHSSDHTVDYAIFYNAREVQIDDHVHHLTFTRQFDSRGNITKEVFPDGSTIIATYDNEHRCTTLRFPALSGSVAYTYEQERLSSVTRLSPAGETRYMHTYHYHPDGSPSEETLIGNLGSLIHMRKEGAFINVNSIFLPPPGSEKQKNDFTECNCNLDTSLYNPMDAEMNALNELLSYAGIYCSYDLNGNLITKKSATHTMHFTYDALGRLVKASDNDSTTVEFIYDLFGRRWSKQIDQNNRLHTEHFLYLGDNELLALNSDGSLKELRVPGASFHPSIIHAIAIETRETIYAPIYNTQGNICTLIDLDTKHTLKFSSLDPFGTNLHTFKSPCPWLFASKRFDAELNLVYFGHRYYAPDLQRWITPDPLGFIDDLNPYTFVYNNPLHYIDPDGRFAFAIPILVWGAPFLTVLVDSLIIGVASWGTYTLHKEINGRLDRKRNLADKEIPEPRFNGKDLGKDPRKCPEGFTWKGKGTPESGKGNYINEATGEKLHPDINHLPPKEGHWGYRDGHGKEFELYENRWEFIGFY